MAMRWCDCVHLRSEASAIWEFLWEVYFSGIFLASYIFKKARKKEEAGEMGEGEHLSDFNPNCDA